MLALGVLFYCRSNVLHCLLRKSQRQAIIIYSYRIRHMQCLFFTPLWISYHFPAHHNATFLYAYEQPPQKSA